MSRDPVIVTERLLLRRLAPRDLAPLADMYGDEETMRFIGDGSTADWDRTSLAVERHTTAPFGTGLLATVLRSTGEFVGRCGYLEWDIDGAIETEIGWMIGRSHWGNGYATEAAIALRDYGFEHLGKERLISLIHPDNTASIRVAEKAGETLWRVWQHKGNPVLIYAVTAQPESESESASGQ